MAITIDKYDELADDIFDQIIDLSEDGEDLFENGDFQEAIDKWSTALQLLPEPKDNWQAALWLYTSLGDGYRYLGDLDQALKAFKKAYEGVEGASNPYVLYSLGATLYDLNRKDEAVSFLLKAYEIEGKDIFAEDGVTYLAFLDEKHLLSASK